MKEKAANLTRGNISTIFKHEGPHDFMAKGGAKIVSAGSMQTANPELTFVANKVLANGGSILSSSEMGSAPKAMAYTHFDTKRMSHGGMDGFDSARAAKIVENAETEIAAKQKALTKAMTKSY